MLASEVMDLAAALLNDRNKSIFTYSAQTEYLNLALSELREIMEQNNVPVTNAVESDITITAGITGIGGPSSNPALPPRFVEPQELLERIAGSSNSYVPMTKKDFLPELGTTTYLQYWTWQEQMIKFLGATGDVQVKIKYIADAVPKVTQDTDVISIINAKTFLANRTAGLCAQYIGENEARAGVLNGNAQTAIDRFLSISAKGRQSIFTRRKPFMASYRSNSRNW